METFLNDALNHVQSLLFHTPIVSATIGVLWGLLWCFLGYRLFRAMMVASGMLAGGVLGYGLGMAFGAHYALGIVGACILALVFGVIFYILVYIFVFLLGMAICGGLTYGILVGIGTVPARGILTGTLLAGLGGAVLALVWMRAVLGIYTALGGAANAVMSVVILIVGLPATKDPAVFQQELSRSLTEFFDHYWYYPLVAWMLLAAAGAAVQLSGPRKKHPEPEPVRSDT